MASSYVLKAAVASPAQGRCGHSVLPFQPGVWESVSLPSRWGVYNIRRDAVVRRTQICWNKQDPFWAGGMVLVEAEDSALGLGFVLGKSVTHETIEEGGIL